jgi:hypothetical protein
VVETRHRSIHPNIPGVPWWAAVLIATTATAVGYAIDSGSGHKELTHVFAGFYVAGCVAAVLAVRQGGVFTTVIQPPLILFCAVPGAYWLFHGGKVGNLKDLLINCGYPLIERFPLMLGTAGAVLLIGLVRWYLGNRSPAPATSEGDTATGAQRPSFFSGMAAKLGSLLGIDPDEQTDEASDSQAAPPIRRARETRASRARSSRSAKRPTHSRSRHARPPLEDTPEPVAERPRRNGRRSPTPARDLEAADPPRRSRRRPRPQGEEDLRAQPPREMRRDPHSRRSPYERPAPRSSRFDPYDMYDAPDSAGPAESFNRYERYGPSYEPYEPPRRRAAPTGPNGANPTHHPISRVRYRGEAAGDEPRERYGDEPRADRRSRSRDPRRHRAESWEYDI